MIERGRRRANRESIPVGAEVEAGFVAATDDLVIILRKEVPQVGLAVTAYEQVRVRVDTVTRTEAVTVDLQREDVEVDQRR